MTDIIFVTDAEPLEGHSIRVTFSDGAIKEIDLEDLFAARGVFDPIREQREIIEQVRVNPESRTVEWPGEVDLDPVRGDAIRSSACTSAPSHTSTARFARVAR